MTGEIRGNMNKSNTVDWIRAGIVGSVEVNGQGFGFILRDKKRIATPIVEYASNDCHDIVTGEQGFTVYRIVLHPFTYSDGILRCIGRDRVWWLDRVEGDAKAIIALCCGNLVERARVYIANDLPIEDEELLPDPRAPEHVKSAWMAEHGAAFESLPFRITATQARNRYADALYTTWQDWPPDRNLSLLHYDGDAEEYVESDPNEVYEWQSLEPGFYVRHNDGSDKEIIGGPFDTPEQSMEWAWTQYYEEPHDVPR
jgi:hypothetical protein